MPSRLALSLLRSASIAIVLLASVSTAAAPRETRSPAPRAVAEFWVVEPNEGQSAGGHVAIRIGDWIYHVEHRGDGLIADRRTSRRQFEEIYRRRGNRRIEAIPLALDDAQKKRLEIRLETRFFERARRLDQLDALDEQVRWLEDAIRMGRLETEIPGLGFFESEPSSCNDPANRPMADFHAEIAATYGPEWLPSRRSAARRETLAWLERIVDPEAAEIETPAHFNPGGEIRRLVEAAQSWAAYDVILECQAVRSDRIHPVPISSRSSALTTPISRARRAWRASRDEVVAQLRSLMGSERSDLGLSILLAWARWSALERSIATGRLHVLDPFSEVVENTQGSAFVGHVIPESWIPRLREEAERAWRDARIEFESLEAPLESRFFTTERALHALRHAQSLTLHAGVEPRSLSASVSTRYASAAAALDWPADLDPRVLEEAHRDVAAQAALQRRATARALKYQLLTRNCVTELLSELEAVLGATRTPVGVGVESSAPIGLSGGGRFIPVVAGWRVESSMSAGPRRILESARAQMIEGMRPQSNAFTLSLRESNTLTSQTYRSHPADSSFLFFSDGPTWIRPLSGIANLGYALGSATLGILSSPIDRGVLFRRGIEGMLMSVPELLFLRVRQGSYAVAPPLPPLDSSWLLDPESLVQSDSPVTTTERSQPDP